MAAALFVAGCATPAPPASSSSVATAAWSGRLAVRVDGQPPQSFSAAFELKGHAQTGDLALRTPLGNTAAQLAWAPGRASLRSGSQVQEFDSLDALVTHATGTPLPVAALFDWLAGTPTPADGWEADLSELQSAGRLQARRLAPPPAAELRLVLDR